MSTTRKLPRNQIAYSKREPLPNLICDICGEAVPRMSKSGPRPRRHDKCKLVALGLVAVPANEDAVAQVTWPKRLRPRVTGGRGLILPDKASKLKTTVDGWPGTVKGTPWTVEHFKRWCEQLIFEDGEHHPPEDWQLDFVRDLFSGFEEAWLVVPEGNSKTTLISELGLYHLDNTRVPWVPVGASSRDQAEILFGQAQGFVERSLCLHGEPNEECCGVPGLQWNRTTNPMGPFVLAGHRQIRHKHMGGRGMKVYAADVETADGVIPTLSFIDEGHRLKHLGLYRTWHGKGEKRGGQVVMISTAGEPGGDFEVTRERMRTQATDKKRKAPSFLRAITDTTVLHEYAIPQVSMAKDLEVVKAANPLEKISIASLQRKLNSPSLDYGESWLRLTCNVPARSTKAAVSEVDWERAYTEERIPSDVPIIVGMDIAFIMDTTAIVPMWIKHSRCRIVDRVEIITPPRDGSMLPPDEIKAALMKIHARNPIAAVVMDSSQAKDILAWIATGSDGPHAIAVDRAQTSQLAVEDYANLMEALRGGKAADDEGPDKDPWLYHNGDPALRTHVMNAIARKVPGDKYVFDRPSPTRAAALQDKRVIDALVALGFANTVAATGWDFRPQPMVAVVGR